MTPSRKFGSKLPGRALLEAGEIEWIQSFSDSAQKLFYTNKRTGEKTYEKPEGVEIHVHKRK